MNSMADFPVRDLSNHQRVSLNNLIHHEFADAFLVGGFIIPTDFDIFQRYTTVDQAVFMSAPFCNAGGFIGKFAGHYAQGTGPVEVTLVDIDPVASM